MLDTGLYQVLKDTPTWGNNKCYSKYARTGMEEQKVEHWNQLYYQALPSSLRQKCPLSSARQSIILGSC